MEYLKTNLAGKVRNLPHFKGEALLPVFEAIVNSIQAIEERGNVSTGHVEVNILRDTQGTLSDMDRSEIKGFSVTDNGIGFDDPNFDSFETADSAYKHAKGGKGVGRFLWLKAFERVDVDSIYKTANGHMRRKFSFATDVGIKQTAHVRTNDGPRTIVDLKGFKREYRELPSAYKTTAKIAQRILEHCLSYFISNAAPRITVRDENEHVSLNDLFQRDYKNNITSTTIQLEGQEFQLSHIKLYSTYDKMHNIVLCANRRDVKPLSLAKALGTSAQFDESDRKFTYALYVTSSYLDQYANNYRLDFDIPDDAPLQVGPGFVSMNQITSALTEAAKTFLDDYLVKNKTRKQDLVAEYVASQNPALRAVPHYCPEIYDEIEPNSSPEKIDEVLYHHKGKAEFAIRKKHDNLLKTQAKSLAEVEDSYKELASQINDFQKDNLVNYLCDRKKIIALLERKLNSRS